MVDLLRRWGWAEGQVDRVCREASDFLLTRPVAIDWSDDAQGNRTYIARVIRPVPDRIPLLIGDALQAMRSPLDNLAWALASLHAKPPSERVRFPVAETQQSWSSFTGSAGQEFDTAHLTQIEQLQPFKSAEPQNSALWQLHRLAIQDRHRALVVGFHAATRATFTAWGPPGNKPNPQLQLGVIQDGQQVGYWQMAGDWQELDFPPITFEFDLVFEVNGPAGGRPVCSTLLELSTAVRTALDQFAHILR